MSRHFRQHIMFQVHVHIRPEVRGQPRPAQRGLGSGAQVSSKLSNSASNSFIRRLVITEKAPTRAFSWLKAATTAFTFKTLLRHYPKQALTPRSLNVKLGPRRNYHEGRAAIRH